MKVLTRALLALMALTPLACSAADSSSAFELGTHYKQVRTVQAPADPAKVEVTEVFWYGCPHCFQFEPYIDRWLKTKAADVTFVQVPTSLGRPIGLTHSKAFYAAELLGISDKVHKPLFGMIHGQGAMMDTPEVLRAFYIERAGITAGDFDNAFSGFAVDSRVRRAETLVRDLGVSSVPTVIVGGKYYSNGSMAGSYDKLLEVIDFLVDKQRREQK